MDPSSFENVRAIAVGSAKPTIAITEAGRNKSKLKTNQIEI